MTPGVVKLESSWVWLIPEPATAVLGLAITQRDDRDARQERRLVHRVDQVEIRGRRVVGQVGRVVDDDRRAGRDRMRPFDVERGFAHDARFCVVTPFWSTTWKLGGSGMPKYWSKVCRSASSVGSTPSSTMAIVWPAPVPATVVPPGAGEADLVDAVGLHEAARA